MKREGHPEHVLGPMKAIDVFEHYLGGFQFLLEAQAVVEDEGVEDPRARQKVIGLLEASKARYIQAADLYMETEDLVQNECSGEPSVFRRMHQLTPAQIAERLHVIRGRRGRSFGQGRRR